MHTVREGQVRGLGRKRFDGGAKFVHGLFGLAASA